MSADLTKREREYLDFMLEFFQENDQMPPCALTASHFNVYPNTVVETLKRLGRKGYLDRNQVGKWKRGPLWPGVN